MIKIGVLENECVRLEPLRIEHIDPLLEAAKENRETYDLAPVPNDRCEMVRYVEMALSDAERGAAVPFVIVDRSGPTSAECIVGSTRLMNLEWWYWMRDAEHSDHQRDRACGDPPNVAEIGHVWLSASAQRTPVNTAACHLLMCHAFDVWHVLRLVLKTDARNMRSRRAIERLGGQFEGILRSHQPAPDGKVRDTAMYSIVQAEWSAVNQRISKMLLKARER